MESEGLMRWARSVVLKCEDSWAGAAGRGVIEIGSNYSPERLLQKSHKYAMYFQIGFHLN